jgi:hypothetical protein
MDRQAGSSALEALNAFVGEWSMEASFPEAPLGRAVFEWLSGETFLVQRTQIPHPAAPDSLAIIGFDSGKQSYLQHYFDSRGVARLYEMSFADGVWRLSRKAADFSPLAFAQRFTGTFSSDGRTIDGRWESSSDDSSWEHDFDLRYVRTS